jgi:hypothetical protein
MPRIGVGYGGLSWRKVRAIIEAVFGDWPGTLIVYEEFVRGGSANDPPSPDHPAAARTASAAAVSVSPRGRRNHKGRSRPASGVGGHEGSAEMNVIAFHSVGGGYGCFSNFSPHPVKLKGKTWPTSEHYFQAQKFAGAPDEEEVRRAKSPMVAARMGRSRKRPLRKDWEAAANRQRIADLFPTAHR